MKPIRPICIEPDSFITIFKSPIKKKLIQKPKENEEYKTFFEELLNQYPQQNDAPYNKLQGQVFQVKAIDLPFIIVHWITPQPENYFYALTIDTRKYNFRELSNEYVIALLGKECFNNINNNTDININDNNNRNNKIKMNIINRILQKFKIKK
ncbi:MAG: hypothetical protein ACOCP8_03940 [archaeon]